MAFGGKSFGEKETAAPPAVSSDPLPTGEDELFRRIGTGNIALVRAFMDEAFWAQSRLQPHWKHLELAVLRRDEPMARLLITWGARAGAADLGNLAASTGADYPQLCRMLRRCGLPRVENAPDPASVPKMTLAEISAQETAACAFVDNTFVDQLLIHVPQDWRKLLKAFHKAGAPEAVIAGGALRDTFNERSIKDVDIFLASRGSKRRNRAFLKNVFKKAGLPVHEQVTHRDDYGVAKTAAFPDPATARHTIDAGTYFSFSRITESWNIVAGGGKTKFNIIFSNAAPVKDGGISVISEFDLGFCQIACDGEKITTTPQYRKDVAEKTIRLVRNNPTTREHLERVRRKYPDWSLCHKAEETLYPPMPYSTSSGYYGGGGYGHHVGY